MSMMQDETDCIQWKWQLRDWQKEGIEESVSATEVLIDPLTANYKKRRPLKTVPKVQSVQAKAPEFIDPLGAVLVEDADVAPLGTFDAKWENDVKNKPILVNTLAADNEEYLVKETVLPGFEPWSSKKKAILEQFMAAEKVSIKTNFLPNGIPIEISLFTVNRQNQRLQQLEDASGRKKLANLSREEYVRALNEFRKKLLLAWSTGKRVESIAIMIDLARILASTSCPQFYPSQFVLVTDIFDLFGELVYERLLHKANEERKNGGLDTLPDCFSSEDILPATRETAKNWFRRVGVITELLPRFYVEASIIGCIRFFDSQSLSVNFFRLCEMPNHISQPLVATYARAYICRIIMRLFSENGTSHWKCLNDWMSLSASLPKTTLLAPALEWIVQCVAYRAVSYEDMLPVWNFCRLSEKRSLLLKPFILSVSPEYLCQHAVEFCKLIMRDEEILTDEIISFGRQLLKGDTPECARNPVLRTVWQKISKLANVEEYVNCAIVWIGFAAMYFQLNTVDVMLAHFVKKLSSLEQPEQYNEKIMELVDILVQNRTDLDGLLSTEHFTELLAFLLEEGIRVKCSKVILVTFVNEHRLASCENFRIAYQVLPFCKVLYDSLPIAADKSEVEFVVDLIKRSLDRFCFDKEPERALNFYVDARAALTNSDAIIAYLVTRICNLGYSVLRMGSISRTGASFLRACIANGFITIASVADPTQQVYLYLQCGVLGLMANSLPQVDAIVKASIELLAVCHSFPPERFCFVASAFLAFLVVVPNSPNKKPLYAFNAFLNAIDRYPWNGHHLEHGRLLLQCLHYFSAMRLSSLPYHVGSVLSNDAIYGCSVEFLDAVTAKEGIVIEKLERILEESGPKVQNLSLELLELITSIGSLNEVALFIPQLWEKCSGRNDLAGRKYVVYLELKRCAADSKVLRRVLQSMIKSERELEAASK